MSSKQRIPAAYYSKQFSFGNSLGDLRTLSEEVTPREYDSYMKGLIYCPGCTVPLIRVPQEKEITSSNRAAHFKHKRGFQDIRCGFRTNTPLGKKFSNEESIQKAIEDGELSIISEWIEEPPEIMEPAKGSFDEAQIEDKAGPETEISIGRHDGQHFNVPSVLSSVFSLCRNFTINLPKYFYFPGNQHPVRLIDALISTTDFDKTLAERENLYYGEITGYLKLNYRNIIKVSCGDNTKINLFTHPENDTRRNIGKGDRGRWILFHGEVFYKNGQPRAMMDRWGQYALLPEMYEETIKSVKEIKKTIKKQ